MKVKALLNYYDKVEKRQIKKDEKFEVATEKRLKELLGNNKEKIICCALIEAEHSTKEIKPKGSRKGNAKRK